MSFKVRKLNHDNDWTFGRGLNDYLNGHEKVEQMICTRIKEIKGDWFANTRIGIDYYNLLGQKGTLKMLESSVYETAKATEGVLSITSVSSDLNHKTRTGIINVRGKTIYDKKFELSIGI